MHARFEDASNQENNVDELELSLDLYTCPMTRQVIRHPVLAADGHRYELEYLLQYVRQGGTSSPLRAGTGDIYPVLYDPSWKELLELLVPHHSDRYHNYDFVGMVDEINELLQERLSINRVRARLDDDGREVHVAIGNKMIQMFCYYFIFSMTFVSILHELIPRPLRTNDAFSISFYFSAILSMTAGMSYLEARMRIDNDNDHGILGGIANQYYSLFKRPERHREFQLPPQRPGHF